MAVAISTCHLWGFVGNLTVPWLLSCLAIGLMVILTTAALTGQMPGEWSAGVSAFVIAGISGILGIGMVVDSLSYGPFDIGQWLASAAEWAGFTILLAFLFWIAALGAQRRRKKPLEDSARENERA